MQRGRLLSLVERLRGTGSKGDVNPTDDPGKEGVIVEPFLYQERVLSLQRNAGRVITEAIAHTPERYEDAIRRNLATALAEDGRARTQAINFFNLYVASVIAEYADILEDNKEYIIEAAFRAAKADAFYRGVMTTVETMGRQVKRDRTWSIEEKVNEFVTQQRWEERYVPIIRKYMDKEY